MPDCSTRTLASAMSLGGRSKPTGVSLSFRKRPLSMTLARSKNSTLAAAVSLCSGSNTFNQMRRCKAIAVCHVFR